MQGHAAKFGTAIVVAVVAALAVLLGASFWPASGQEDDASAGNDGAPSNVGAAEFDGRLYANPETGCVETPPQDLSQPDVVLVEPSPTPAAEDDAGERMEEGDEGAQVPLVPHVVPHEPNVHVEPWPACDESAPGTLVGERSRNTGHG